MSATRIGIVNAETGRIFDLAAAASRGGASDAPFGSMLALIDADDAGFDLARELIAGWGGDTNLWADLARVELLAPLPEPRQMRDAMSFAGHIRQSARGSRARLAMLEGGRAAFDAAMRQPLG